MGQGPSFVSFPFPMPVIHKEYTLTYLFQYCIFCIGSFSFSGLLQHILQVGSNLWMFSIFGFRFGIPWKHHGNTNIEIELANIGYFCTKIGIDWADNGCSCKTAWTSLMDIDVSGLSRAQRVLLPHERRGSELLNGSVYSKLLIFDISCFGEKRFNC